MINGKHSDKLCIAAVAAAVLLAFVMMFGDKIGITVHEEKVLYKENIVACEVAQIAEKNGISAITIHGRTRDEFYSGKADLDIIKKVKEIRP